MRPGFGVKGARKQWLKNKKMAQRKLDPFFDFAFVFIPKPHAHGPVSVQ